MKTEQLELHHKAEADERTMLGFWIYLMTDLLMFAGLFAAYAVLHGNTFGGPSSKELFDMPFALAETLILLTSSFTCGLGMLAARATNKNQVFSWFGITFLLGFVFVVLEVTEFNKLVGEGNSWQRSAFLSSFFTLVATHGLHISVGLLWMAVCMWAVWVKGLTHGVIRKLALLSLFWHFLDIVWIFIFTVVYLMGTL